MSKKPKNIISQEIERLAKEFGYQPSSIASRAFKNSRKAEQLKRRDESDKKALSKLLLLERELEGERRQRLKKLFPQQGNLSEDDKSIVHRGGAI